MWKTRLLALVFGATLGWSNSEASETQSHRKTRKEPSAIAAQPTTIRVALGKEARELVQRRLKQGTLSVLRLKIADMELPPEHVTVHGPFRYMVVERADCTTPCVNTSPTKTHFAMKLVLTNNIL